MVVADNKENDNKAIRNYCGFYIRKTLPTKRKTYAPKKYFLPFWTRTTYLAWCKQITSALIN